MVPGNMLLTSNKFKQFYFYKLKNLQKQQFK